MDKEIIYMEIPRRRTNYKIDEWHGMGVFLKDEKFLSSSIEILELNTTPREDL